MNSADADRQFEAGLQTLLDCWAAKVTEAQVESAASQADAQALRERLSASELVVDELRRENAALRDRLVQKSNEARQLEQNRQTLLDRLSELQRSVQSASLFKRALVGLVDNTRAASPAPGSLQQQQQQQQQHAQVSSGSGVGSTGALSHSQHSQALHASLLGASMGSSNASATLQQHVLQQQQQQQQLGSGVSPAPVAVLPTASGRSSALFGGGLASAGAPSVHTHAHAHGMGSATPASVSLPNGGMTAVRSDSSSLRTPPAFATEPYSGSAAFGAASTLPYAHTGGPLRFHVSSAEDLFEQQAASPLRMAASASSAHAHGLSSSSASGLGSAGGAAVAALPAATTVDAAQFYHTVKQQLTQDEFRLFATNIKALNSGQKSPANALASIEAVMGPQRRHLYEQLVALVGTPAR